MRHNRIAVIDDQEAVRRGIGEMLDAYGYAVVLFDSAAAFLNDSRRGDIGCVVSDVRMPDMDGIALVRRLATEKPPIVPVILISGQADIPMAVMAVKAGAIDFIEKPVDDVRLIAAINRAMARPASSPGAQDLTAQIARFQRLTTRETKVFDMVAEGHTSPSIASNLAISVRTVEGYRAQIMEKLQLTSVAAVVRLAIRLGRIAP